MASPFSSQSLGSQTSYEGSQEVDIADNPGSDEIKKCTIVDETVRLAKHNLCGYNEKPNPSIFCLKCRSVRYCNQDCANQDSEMHDKVCSEIYNSEKALLTRIQAILLQKSFTNTGFHYVFKDFPVAHFRIIHNPEEKPLSIDLVTFTGKRVLFHGNSLLPLIGKIKAVLQEHQAIDSFSFFDKTVSGLDLYAFASLIAPSKK